jgi:hypothetical protein
VCGCRPDNQITQNTLSSPPPPSLPARQQNTGRRYCTDNGLMVAWAGVERLRLGLANAPPSSLAAVEGAVDVLPRWPLGPVDPRGGAGAAAAKIFGKKRA